MNLEESEIFSSELAKNNKQKKMVLALIIVLSIILVLLIAATIAVATKEANRFKIFYNGKENKKLPSTFYVVDEATGDYYVSIEMMAALEGYSYNPGEFKKYEETNESCNVSKGVEVTSLIANKDYYYKTIDKSTYSEYIMLPYGSTNEKEALEFNVVSANGSVETFETTKPVKLINDKLYAPLETIRDVFNVRIQYDKKGISFQSLNYVYALIQSKIVEAGYTTISSDFENLRALVYDMAVIAEGEGATNGVVSIVDFKPVISAQYSELQFIQNSKEFLAAAVNENGERTVGLISATGNTIIKPTEFEDISVLSDKNGLYLVKDGQYYGVLNRDGDEVVYVEYNKIGLSNMSDFPLEDATNQSVLFEKFIPVSLEGKYGLYNLDGEETLKPVYEDLGYRIVDETVVSNREMNVLSIPAELGIKGLVIKHNGLYGVYDMTTEALCIPCVFSKIYAEKKAGVTTYYMVEQGTDIPIRLDQFIEQNNLKNVDADGNLLPQTQTNLNYTTDGNGVEPLTPSTGDEPVAPVTPDEPATPDAPVDEEPVVPVEPAEPTEPEVVEE